jgi:dTDP-4-amino-4,6-dideoxygalactose transaminase
MILMNDFQKEYSLLQKPLAEAIERVMKSGWYILGQEVEIFEKNAAAFLGVKYAVGVGNGFDALYLILRSLNIGPGDEVITTPNTAFATTLAILKSGAKPVFADISLETRGINAETIKSKITKKTKALMPVHIYGNMTGIMEIKKLADDQGFYLIEDACQAFGAKLNGKSAGTIGKAGAFSFYPTKNLGAIGDGGMLVTNDSEIFEQSKVLRNYGQSQRYYHDLPGINSRLDELQAAILSVKLKQLTEFTRKRIEIAGYYDKYINNPKLRKPVFIKDGSHVYHLYVLQAQNKELREEYLKKFKENNIAALIHYPVPIYKQKAITEKYPELANAESFANTCFSIPIHPFLTEDECSTIAGVCNSL